MVGESDVNGMSLTFQPEGSLTGTVRVALVSPSTTASPMVNVNLRPAVNGVGFAGPIPQAQWDSGHLAFEFRDVPVGQFLLNANVNGPGAYVKSGTLHGQDVLNQPFTIDGTLGPIDVVVSDDTGGIDVTVSDADGHPVAASILLQAATGMRRFLNSGDDGHATQKNLPVGEYRAWAFDNLQAVPYAEDAWMNQNAGSGERVTVTSGGSATISLRMVVSPFE
jgi:hypothetical protein